VNSVSPHPMKLKKKKNYSACCSTSNKAGSFVPSKIWYSCNPDSETYLRVCVAFGNRHAPARSFVTPKYIMENTICGQPQLIDHIFKVALLARNGGRGLLRDRNVLTCS
jgi:hypothetical protein